MKRYKLNYFHKFVKYFVNKTTGAELNKKTGLSRSNINYWKTAYDNDEEPNITSNTLRKIAIGYNCSDAELKEMGISTEGDNDNTIPFAERLDYIMKKNKKKQKIVADNLGIKQQKISNWLKGDNIPTMQLSSRLAKEIGTNIFYLYGYSEDSSPEVKLLTKENIMQELKIGEKVFDTIKNFNSNMKVVLNNEENEVPFDIKPYLINEELINVFEQEAYRLFQYCTNNDFFLDYEHLVNTLGKTDIDNLNYFPFDITNIVRQNLSRIIYKKLKEFIANELNVTDIDNILKQLPKDIVCIPTKKTNKKK